MKKNLSIWQRSVPIAVLLATLAAQAQDAPTAPPPTERPAAPPADARGNRGGGANNFQRGGFGGIMFDEKQRELLQEARQVNAEELRKLNEKLNDAQKEFVKAVVAEKYDEKVVREKADLIGKIQADILALNGKAFATVSPTLKSEQREALEGNSRMGIMIISPTVGGFGGMGGRTGFAPGGPGGGNDAGGPGFRRPGGGGVDAGAPAGGGERRRRGDNPPQ